MNQSFSIFFDRLTLVAFFSGYPIVYALAMYLIKDVNWKNPVIPQSIKSSLSLAYFVVVLLFWGMIIADMFPSITFSKIISFFKDAYSWHKISLIAALVLAFKYFKARPNYALLHSLFFLLLLLEDLLSMLTGHMDKLTMNSEFKLYFYSILLNSIVLLSVTSIRVVLQRKRLI